MRTQNQPDNLQNQLIEMEKKFLEIFLSTLTNKKLIDKALEDRQSIYINPSFIYVLSKEANPEQLSDGYYFIENENTPKLWFVKNRKKEDLILSNMDEVINIIQSIKNKKPDYDNTNLSFSFIVKNEISKLIEIIHTIPNHENAFFTEKKYLSLKACEKLKLFTSDGAIDPNVSLKHSIYFDEQRINLNKSYELTLKQELSTREKLIIDAIIAESHHQIFTTFSELIKLCKEIPRNVIQQLNNIHLKGAPFYEPTEEFKMEMYSLLFKLGSVQYLEDILKNDAEKFFYAHKTKNANTSQSELYNLTAASLFEKYAPYLRTFDEEMNFDKFFELRLMILKHLDLAVNAKTPTDRLKPEAIRLITNRGEGLVKMLNPIFMDFEQILKNPAAPQLWKDQMKKVDEKWEFAFQQLLDPKTHRPERQAIPKPINGFSFSPLLQKQVNPDELVVKSQDHTVMTSTTLLPIDEKMSLFGAEHGHALGLLFDIRMCDLVGEHFVFDTDTYTINDWWHNPTQTRYHNEFKGYTVNKLIEVQKLHEKVHAIRVYNEILSGVSAAGMVAILFQPVVGVPRSSNEKDMNYYVERLNLIYRKMYIAELMGRHLPIIIYDAHKGVYQYTIEEQRMDLENILNSYPGHPGMRAMADNFKNLCERIPEETDYKNRPNIQTDNIAVLQTKKNLRMEILKTQNDINDAIKKLYRLMNRQALSNYGQQGMDAQAYVDIKRVLDHLIESKNQNIKVLFAEFKKITTDEEHDALVAFTENQNSLINKKCEEETTLFHKIINNISSNIVKEGALTFLIKLLYNPEYVNEKNIISNLKSKQVALIKKKLLNDISKDPQLSELNNSSFMGFFAPLNPVNERVLKAKNDFDENIKFNPNLFTIEQLYTTQMKREAIQIIESAIRQLVAPKVYVSQYSENITHHTYDEAKVEKYKSLIQKLRHFDINLPLNSFINKYASELNINYGDPVIRKLINLSLELYLPNNQSNSQQQYTPSKK
jgi:hypothetical protein